MIKKTLLIAAALLFALAGTAGAQDSEDYPLAEDSIDATDTTVAPGDSIVLGLQVCPPGSTATFTFDDGTVLGTGTANSSGRAEATVTIPSSAAPGTHTITGVCADLTQVLSITVTGPTQAGPLPKTGSDSTTPMTQIAIAAIAGGGLFVILANKRRRNGSPRRESAGV